MLTGYDFEIFKHDWMVALINPFERTRIEIVNDREQLKQYYEAHKRQLWTGYNSRNYDQYIMKAILLGMDPKKVNDWIILKGRKGWEYSSLFNQIPLYNYDVLSSFYSLKQLEGFMGNNIHETPVPFDIDRPLTPQEIKETMKYCMDDVENTLEVFMETKPDFDAQMSLIKTFGLPLSNISKTKAQTSATVLGCVKKEWFDEWELIFVDTLRIKKYTHVVDWFKDPLNHDYTKSLVVDVCGVPHKFAFGGLHGAPEKPLHRTGLLLHVDVNSFYPSIMIRYDMLSRNVSDKAVYKQIYDTRLVLKKAGKKAEQAPFKIVLNATYGICKDPTSAAYDPRQANNVCVNGQLLLLDLLEHLEAVKGFELIQSNTDGLIIQIPDTDESFEAVDDVCYEWEQRTGMGLGFDVITEIFQKDVNNYLFKFENGKIERKGAWLKPLSRLDNDLPIVNKALVDYMTNGTPVEKTIGDCDDLIMFQKIVKLSSKYKTAWHNGVPLHDKTFRVFASRDPYNSYIGKQKNKGATIEKFGNTPEHCFIVNENVNGVHVGRYPLDKQWYIDLAHKRLQAFGIG